MRGFHIFTYSLRQGVVGLRRNRMFTLASVGTIAACLFLFGIFYFVLSNFEYIIKAAETSVGVSVFFDEGTSQATMQTIGDIIKERPEVDHIVFVSADAAWERFKKDNFKDSPDLIESFGEDNPLADSASYEIYLRSISMQDDLVDYLETIKGIRDVKRSDEMARGLSKINGLVSIVSASLILILVFVSIFLIYSAVSTGITVRRPEIAIMRLMGASDMFIRLPFIVEGVVMGIIGTSIPMVILFISYDGIVNYITTRFSIFSDEISFLDRTAEFSILIPIAFMLGVGIGFLGSFITVRRHLAI